MVRRFIRGERDARDDDHDDEIPGAPRLQVSQRAEDRERWDSDELRPKWERLKIPREFGQAMAPPDDVHLEQRRPTRKRKGAEQGLAFCETRRVV